MLDNAASFATVANAQEPDIIELDREHVWHHLTQHKIFETTDPLVMAEGKGMILTDVNGREYLDATSGGVWTVNIGYGRETVAKAVADQLTKMCFFGGAGGTVPGALFADLLMEKMPGFNRAYFSNSGSEANEKGYKMVRQLSHLEGDGAKHKIVYRNRDYHGTTIAALSSSGQSQRRDQFGPFVDGFVEFSNCCCYRCPFNKKYGECNIECARDLETVILREGPDTVGSVVLEPITAGGGAIPPVPEYFPIIQEICQKYDVLLHIDEVVCGFGRTGEWFGYQHYDVQPDIVTMAKGAASGYAAISVTATTEALFDRFKADPSAPMDYFRDISTFGGCAGSHAAAVECMRIVEDENLILNAQEQGAYLKDRALGLMDKHAMIGDVRGVGLLVGLEIVRDRETKAPVHESYIAKIVGHCARNGVLLGRTNRSFDELNNTLLITPALIVGRTEIDEIISALDKALEETPIAE